MGYYKGFYGKQTLFRTSSSESRSVRSRMMYLSSSGINDRTFRRFMNTFSKSVNRNDSTVTSRSSFAIVAYNLWSRYKPKAGEHRIYTSRFNRAVSLLGIYFFYRFKIELGPRVREGVKFSTHGQTPSTPVLMCINEGEVNVTRLADIRTECSVIWCGHQQNSIACKVDVVRWRIWTVPVGA